MLEKLVMINSWVLVVAACFCATGSIIGSFLFLYTCVIGLIDGIRNKNFDGILINGTLGGMNMFFVLKFLIGVI